MRPRLSLRKSNIFREQKTQERASSRWMLAMLTTLYMVCTAHAIDSNRSTLQYITDSWTTENGFPGGRVDGIAQTSDGYLWIGTENGLFRFDGISFLDIQKSYPAISPITHVLGLASDFDGDLWVRLQGPNALHYHNGRFETVAFEIGSPEAGITAMSKGNSVGIILSTLLHSALRYTNGKVKPLASTKISPSMLVLSIAETSDGKVWIGTRDDGLFYIVGGQFVAVTDGLPDSKINALLPTKDGKLWIGTDNGAVQWNGTKISEDDSSPLLRHIQVLTMVQDRDANLWIGTAHGLLRVNSKGASWLEDRKSRLDMEITALFEDREGNLWIGSAQGMQRLRNGSFVTYSIPEGFPSESNGPIYVDSDLRTWVAPLVGGMYWMHDGKIDHIASDGLDRDEVYSIAGGKDELWIGRQRGGLTRLVLRGRGFAAKTYTQAEGLAQNSVYAVHKNQDGSVWAGTLSGGVSKFNEGKFTTYTTAEGLASNTISAIEEGNNGTMWFATRAGLNSLSNGRWRTYTVADGLPSEDIICLLRDSAGVLWIGTGRGLAIFRLDKIVNVQNSVDSLHEAIFGLAEDSHGSLWLATSGHILKVDREKLLRGVVSETDIREYGLADGLYGMQGVRRDRSVFKDQRGWIWFSLNRGISVVNPDQATGNSAPAITHIQSISADGTPIAMQRVISIAGSHQRIAFDYVGLSLAIPEHIRFRYRLDGFDHDWSEPVVTRQAIYTNLGPGPYRFRIISSDSDGKWSGTEAQLSFKIEPVFWQTWWFRFSCVLCLALMVWFFYRLRMHQMVRQLNVRFEERLAKRMRISHELHDTLLQGFLSASMQLHVAADKLPDDSPARPLLSRVLELMEQVINEGRNTLRGLRSSNIAPEKLEQAFSRISQELDTQQQVAYRVIVEGLSRPLHPVIRDEVYRIGREALVNAFRHSGANNIEVEVEYTASYLRV